MDKTVESPPDDSGRINTGETRRARRDCAAKKGEKLGRYG
jgi:hypothetical protein